MSSMIVVGDGVRGGGAWLLFGAFITQRMSVLVGLGMYTGLCYMCIVVAKLYFYCLVVCRFEFLHS